MISAPKNKLARFPKLRPLLFILIFALIGGYYIWHSLAAGPYNTEDFSSNPKWQSQGNVDNSACAPRQQNFGWSNTTEVNGSGQRGEIGGIVSDDAQHVAYYAKRLPAKSLNDHLFASGTAIIPVRDEDSEVLFGWFNNNSTDWRANNFLGFRISDGYSAGRPYNTVFIDFSTKSGLVGGGQFTKSDGNTGTLDFQDKVNWTIEYLPSLGSYGGLNATINSAHRGSVTLQYLLSAAQKADGAAFDHFGIYNSQRGGVTTTTKTIFLDDITLNSGDGDTNQTFDFASNPGWEGQNNKGSQSSCWIKYRDNFGYSQTNHAGGATGEIGGLMWMGMDGQQSYYAVPTQTLTPNDPLYLTGKIVVNHTHPDTDIPYIGWFKMSTSRWGHPDDTDKLQVQNMIGVRVGGTSRQGHNLQPTFFNNDKVGSSSGMPNSLEPKTIARDFWFCYVPNADAATNAGRLTAGMEAVPSAGLPARQVAMKIPGTLKTSDTSFDYFGVISPNVGDAMATEFYLDDLRYTTAPGDAVGPTNRCGSVASDDTIAPTVSLTRPANGANLAGVVRLSANATDNVSVKHVEFKDGDNLIADVSTSTSSDYSATWDTTSDLQPVTNGEHELKVTAYDGVGNSTDSVVHVNIDNPAGDTVPPTVTSISRASTSLYTNSPTVNYNVKFSENVTGVDANDFVIASSTPSSGTNAGSITGVSGSGENYTVSVSTGSDGELGLNLNDNDTIMDSANNLLGGPGIGNGSFKGDVYHVDKTTPEVKLTSPTQSANGSIASVSGTINVSANASDKTGVAGVQFLLDGQDLMNSLASAPYSIAVDTKAISNGKHCFAAKAIDLATNFRISSNVCVNVDNSPPPTDTTPPTVPTNLAVTNSDPASPTTALVQWGPSTDSGGSGLSGYNVYRDGNLIGFTDKLSYSDPNLANGKTYTYAVSALDNAKNQSQKTSPVSITIKAVPPKVTITSPEDGAEISGNVTVTATAQSSAGIANVSFKANNVAIANPLTSEPYTTIWNSLKTSDNKVKLGALATANDGQTGLAEESVTVNNSSPDIAIKAPKNNSVVKGSNYQVTTKVSNQLGTVFTQLMLDGRPLVPSFKGNDYDWQLSAIKKGDHKLQAIATSKSGITAQSAIVNITVRSNNCNDSKAPTVPENVQAFKTKPTKVLLAWNSSSDKGCAGVAGYAIYRDDQLVRTVEGNTFADKGLTPGHTYKYSVVAIDFATNMSDKSKTISATTAVTGTN